MKNLLSKTKILFERFYLYCRFRIWKMCNTWLKWEKWKDKDVNVS